LLATGLFLVLFIGLLMALQMPKYRRMSVVSALSGLLVFGLWSGGSRQLSASCYCPAGDCQLLYRLEY
jgi:hypothetical protein